MVGLSAGSLVVDEVLRNMLASGKLTDPDEITFVVAADSSRQQLIKDSKYSSKFDYTYQPAPLTSYDVVVITGEYDGMADMPDRPWNALAVANAMAGAILVHVPVMYGDLSKVPEENITVTVNAKGGTTTHYLVPTATLPLVQLNPRLKSREAALKIKIDKGYSRNDVATVPATALRTLTAEPAAEESPATEPAAPSPSPTPEPESTDAGAPSPTADTGSEADSPHSVAAAKREARAEAAAAKRQARADAAANSAADREAKREAKRAAAASDATE